MDAQIKHICTEVGIPRKSRLKMEEYGIRTIQDLLTVRERIQRSELDGLREEVREKLLVVAEWVAHHPDADVVDEFDEDVYDKMYKDQRWAEKYIEVALGQPYRVENVPLYRDVSGDGVLEAVINKSRDIIMQSQKLRDACGKFDYNSFLDKAIRHFHALVGQESGVLEKLFIVAGRTQAGKTSVKGVIQSMCGLLKIPLVILTKGVDESIDLHVKLVNLSEGTLVQEKHIVVASSKHDRLGYRHKDAKVKEALEGGTHGGTLVIADTKPQVLNKACKALKSYREQLPGGKFVLVVDEADAMFRTRDRHQVFEQALQQLIDLEPSMTVMISATPVPYMLELVYREDSAVRKENIEFFNLEPQENYVGIEDIKPLEMNGKKIYLEQNELTGRTEYTSDQVTVCCANEKNIALYDDALLDIERRKGVLVLDCSCPRVYAVNNIRDKANAVQELYKKRGINIVVITFSGSGLAVRMPSEEWDDGIRVTSDGRYQRHDAWKLIGRLLEYIDGKYGLHVPVFVFGYSKMRRGVSFRSNNRVPTHMLMALGRGHNISTIVQTLGRVTFNGRNTLKENGFDFVTVLTTSSDYTLCTKKQNYINQVSYRIQMGDTFAAAVTGANQQIPDSANFLRHTFRELGRIKGQREQFEAEVDVEKVPDELSPDEEDTKVQYWDNLDAQILLRSLARLRTGHVFVNPGDIHDDLEEAAHYSMSKTKVRELLRKFCDKSLLSKDKDGQFRVPTVGRLMRFVNPVKGGMMPDIPDEDEPSVDLEECVDEPPQLSNTVSNVSEISSAGSKRPREVITIDSDVESSPSISSVSMASAINAPKVVSPEKVSDRFKSAPESFIGQRVAKKFDPNIHFGSVVHYCHDEELWWVAYDDGDNEQYDREDLRKARRLYRRKQSNDERKPPSLVEPQQLSSEPFTDIEGIPLVLKEDKSKTRTCITQPEKKRRVYYAANRDTPSLIAKRFSVDVRQIVRDNKRREGYKSLQQKSHLDQNSPIVLPL